MSDSLSKRGLAALNQPLRADLELFSSAMEDKYDPTGNPEGNLILCIAENLHQTDRMQAKLRQIAAGPIPGWVASYTALPGAPELRQATCEMLETLLDFRGLDPENLAAAAGAAAVIELSAFLLGNPGDCVVIPGPAYMAYTPDLGHKARLQRYDLHARARGTGGRYQIDVDDLDRAHAELGDRFRMLLLTQPNNPTGQVFSASQLETFADWCIERRIHMVVNEIYLFSRFNQSHPVLRECLFREGEIAFASFLPILNRYQSPYLHWWYAVSKDFGLSGLRLGFAYSCNDELLKAWGNCGAPSMASNHTQWMLEEVFRDTAWTRDFLARSQASLTESFATVIQALEGKVAYASAVGSLFAWFDLSDYLQADTLEAEQALWRRIYSESGILLTAPDGMGSPDRGWFRLVHSCVRPDELRVAMQRFSAWLEQARGAG